MPEGPSIVLLKESVSKFTGKKILSVNGSSKIDLDRLLHQKVLSFQSWGKHFLICCKGFVIRIHFLLFGSYLIDEEKDKPVRLRITFTNGELNFYACAIKILEGNVNELYDFSNDIMSDSWDAAKARKKLKAVPEKLICDTLLEQDIFSGVGNIIKNEVLYRVKIHPESVTGKITSGKIKKLIEEARHYSFQFLEWKKNFVLKKHWLAHTKKTCLRCDLPIIKKYTGAKKRRSFYCTKCQKLYQ
jgi:endonuclease-8